jgi:uncharacterized low-complexity protein
MDNKKKSLFTSTLIASALIGGASLSASPNNLFSFDELGSGSEVRTTLATKSISDEAGVLRLEMKCGKDSKTEKSESKSKDAKCGEGKCGAESEDAKKKDKKAQADTEKNTESKSKDAKCGEGKCGK